MFVSDSRSQSSLGSQHETLPHSALSHLTDAQLHNFNNPLFIKFLMSQRNPSDLSSVGGFSNVETGSQVILLSDFVVQYTADVLRFQTFVSRQKV